jgi:NAD-dependent SIR2 family protein deacetylase
MILVVGTSAQVWPAAGYIEKARVAGAKVVTVDPMAEEADALRRLRKGDFAFACDAATTLPILLEPVIGKLQEDGNHVQPS